MDQARGRLAPACAVRAVLDLDHIGADTGSRGGRLQRRAVVDLLDAGAGRAGQRDGARLGHRQGAFGFADIVVLGQCAAVQCVGKCVAATADQCLRAGDVVGGTLACDEAVAGHRHVGLLVTGQGRAVIHLAVGCTGQFHRARGNGQFAVVGCDRSVVRGILNRIRIGVVVVRCLAHIGDAVGVGDRHLISSRQREDLAGSIHIGHRSAAVSHCVCLFRVGRTVIHPAVGAGGNHDRCGVARHGEFAVLISDVVVARHIFVVGVLDDSIAGNVVACAHRGLATGYDHTFDMVGGGKSRVRVSGVGQRCAVIDLRIRVGCDGQILFLYLKGAFNSRYTVVAYSGPHAGYHRSAIHRGDDIGLCAHVGDGAAGGHGHREGMRVAGFESRGGEAGLGERRAVVGLVGILGRKGYLLAIHCQSAVDRRHTVVGGKGWGDKVVAEGVGSATHIGDGGEIGVAQGLVWSHAVAADGHRLLLELGAVVGLTGRAARQGDMAAVHLQGAVNLGDAVAVVAGGEQILITVVEGPACHHIVHAGGHILDLTGDDHMQGIAVRELVVAVGGERHRDG